VINTDNGSSVIYLHFIYIQYNTRVNVGWEVYIQAKRDIVMKVQIKVEQFIKTLRVRVAGKQESGMRIIIAVLSLSRLQMTEDRSHSDIIRFEHFFELLL